MAPSMEMVTPGMMDEPPAVDRVFAIVELLEAILSKLAPGALLRAMQVNKQFLNTITKSVALRRALCLSQHPGISANIREDFNELLRNPYHVLSSDFDFFLYGTSRDNMIKLPNAPEIRLDMEICPHGRAELSFFKSCFVQHPEKWQLHSYTKLHFWKTRIPNLIITVRMHYFGSWYRTTRERLETANVKVSGGITVGQALLIGHYVEKAADWQNEKVFLQKQATLEKQATSGRKKTSNVPRDDTERQEKMGWPWQKFFEDKTLLALIEDTPRFTLYHDRDYREYKMLDANDLEVQKQEQRALNAFRRSRLTIESRHKIRTTILDLQQEVSRRWSET